MTRFSKGFLLLSLLSAGLVSCSDDTPWSGSDTEGGIRLDLQTDGRVMRQTRADEAVGPMVPAGDSFAISLTKSDGSYSKRWSSVEAFNHEKSFPIGDYDVEATYGDVDQEGFDLPAYRGVTNVHVSPGAVSDAQITATLANAMVTINYTDAFKGNFSAYSASVQTEGHDWVVFAQNEDRAAYISPSEVKLNLTLTNAAGERVTIQPAGFTAQPRHHYAVTIGVKDDAVKGDLVLDVVFDEDVVAETVEVPLGDELWTAPAPTITAKGFSTDPVSLIEGETPANPYEFHVFSFGGLHSAVLNVVSTAYTPAFGKSVELVNADALLQSQLKAEGVEAAGFFRNVDKMGVVDVTKFVENLPAGDYKIQLQVVDALTRTSEPTELTLKVNPVTLEMTAPSKVAFLSGEITVDVTTNSPGVRDKVKFMAPDENNRLVNVSAKSVTEISSPAGKASRAGEGTHTYRYVLDVATVSGSEVDVQAIYGKRVLKMTVPVDVPQFDLAVDAFARYIVVKVTPENAAQLSEIVGNLSFYNGNNRILASNIAREESTGLVTITGFTPATKYSSVKAMLGKIEKAVPEFTTEAATDVPNGAFSMSDTSKTIDIKGINAGGQYQYLSSKRINTTNIYAEVPQGWATINDKTCFTGSNPQNTWFMVPSTILTNGEVLLRSVAYDHNGTMPENDNHGIIVREKYSRNAPSSFSSRSAGELFLGSYSFTSSGENRIDGVSFTSRPSSVSFRYRHAPVGNETGVMSVYVKDASGNVLASGTVDLSAKVNTDVKVPLTYKAADFNVKAAKLELCFKSAKGDNVQAPVPSDIADVTNKTATKPIELGTNAYKSLCVGSQLWLDNVKLNYDAPATNARRKARK